MKIKSSIERKKDRFVKRWQAADFAGGTERFQIKLFMRDLFIFVVLPLGTVVLYKLAESVARPALTGSDSQNAVAFIKADPSKSQIIRFASSRSHVAGGGSVGKRSPGTLVRLRLMNRVESFDGASAHAQIIDSSLGSRFVGGTAIGDVVSDPSTNRVALNFRFIRDPKNASSAFPVAARAMSLDGTAGLAAKKKEGFFARAALRSGSSGGAKAESESSNQDFRTLVAKTIAAGMMQEFQEEAGVANKRAQVLSLEPGTEFFAELTDFFPASN